MSTFYQNELLKKNLSLTLLECQTVWIQIRTDVRSDDPDLGPKFATKAIYKQTKVAASYERVKKVREQISVSPDSVFRIRA